jgi:putative cardiolipin synthase
MNSARHARRNSLGLVALTALLLAGCATLPPGSDYPKAASNALTHPEQTRLGRQFAAYLGSPLRARGYPPIEGEHALIVEVRRAWRWRAGRATLDIQYFVIENDDTGKLIQEALLKAADRGVRVRVLLDDEGSRGRTTKLTPLAAHANIELRVFNPAAYRGPVEFLHDVELLGDATRLNYRMHNKLYVVDNEIGIIGGRNIGDAYFQEGRDLEFGDYDVIAAGGIVKDMSASFDAFWNSPLAIPIEALFGGKASAQALVDYRDALAQHHAGMNDKDYMRRLAGGEPLRPLLAGNAAWTWARAEIVYDSPQKSKVEDGEPTLGDDWRAANEPSCATQRFAARARRYVVSRRVEDLGQSARKAAVRILNSFASTDMPVVHSAYQKRRRAAERRLLTVAVLSRSRREREIAERRTPVSHARVSFSRRSSDR